MVVKLIDTRLAAAVVLLLLVAPFAAEAQSAGKIPRIGWLVTGSPTTHGISLAAFRDGLQTLGYREGRNIHIEYRWAEGNVDRLPEFAAELVRLKVDVIVAAGGVGALAAKNATRTIPIVMVGVGEAVEQGLVTSLAHPGGNITGFGTLSAVDMPAKQLEILKQVVPRLERAAVLWSPTNPGVQLSWKAVHGAAAVLRIALSSYEVRNIGELESALVTIPKKRPDGLIVLNDPFVFTYRKNIAEFAAQVRLPAVYGFREFVTAGGLISYGTNISDTYRRAATYVDRILKGANPGDLPVQLPTKFELTINLRTAKALGLTIPPLLLLRADEVLE